MSFIKLLTKLTIMIASITCIYIYIYPFILSIVDEYDKVTDIVLYICNMHILRGYRECHQIALLGVLW